MIEMFTGHQSGPWLPCRAWRFWRRSCWWLERRNIWKINALIKVCHLVFVVMGLPRVPRHTKSISGGRERRMGVTYNRRSNCEGKEWRKNEDETLDTHSAGWAWGKKGQEKCDHRYDCCSYCEWVISVFMDEKCRTPGNPHGPDNDFFFFCVPEEAIQM